MDIRASTVLPARREEFTLRTADGLTLVGEVARPLNKDPVATLLCLHPLPTHGGMMDSHCFRPWPQRGGVRRGHGRAPRRGRRDRLVRGRRAAAAVAAGLVVWHRTRAPVGQRPGGGGRDPGVAATAPGR